MVDDLKKARSLLEGGCTLALCRGSRCVTSAAGGIGDLLRLQAGNEDFRGFCAADRIVGRAAAFLYVLMGVRAVHAAVISEGALDILRRHGVEASFDRCTAAIINREGTGLCPMEEAVAELSDPQQAAAAIAARLRQLQNQRASGVRLQK